MYSPFIDEFGDMVEISMVKYEYLPQLKECEEGYQLEFKELLEDNGKAQLAKEIASFANSEGGWLIIGITDKEKEIKPIEKIDYSQKIGKIMTRIAPMPEIETKFIVTDEINNKGVLLIYVHEGRFTPYICNGSAYVRSGSSKEPIKTSDRGNIEYLVSKGKQFKSEIEKFCVRDFYIPSTYSGNGYIFPVCNVYFKNISNTLKADAYLERDNIIQIINEKSGIFEGYFESMNSLIIKHKNVSPIDACTIMFEIFDDFSAKFFIPLIGNDSSREKIISIIKAKKRNTTNISKLNVVSGLDFVNAINAMINCYFMILKEYKIELKDFCFCVELEKAGGTLLAFNSTTYYNYIERYGIPYNNHIYDKSRINYMEDYKGSYDDAIWEIILNYIGTAFGFSKDNLIEIWQEANETDYPDIN